MTDETREKNYQDNINELEASIKIVFGEEFFEEIKKEWEDFKNACIAEPTTQTGKYGDCPQLKALVMKLRDEMIKQGFVNKEISSFTSGNVIQSLTLEYAYCFEMPKELFEKIESGYTNDGWQYEKEKDFSSTDERKCWMSKIRGKEFYRHSYYNQLDHYFTYLIYITITNRPWKASNFGINWIRVMLFKKKFSDKQQIR